MSIGARCRLLASWPEKRRQARLPIVKSSLTPTRGPPVELNLKESPLTPGREVKVNVHVEPTEKTAACPKMPGSDLGHGHARLRELLSKAAFLKSPAKLDGRTLEREPLSQVDKGLRFHRSNVVLQRQRVAPAAESRSWAVTHYRQSSMTKQSGRLNPASFGSASRLR